jgi:hypothetical protein
MVVVTVGECAEKRAQCRFGVVWIFGVAMVTVGLDGVVCGSGSRSSNRLTR